MVWCRLWESVPLAPTFLWHCCCQWTLHVISQQSCGGVCNSISHHDGDQVTGCANRVQDLGCFGELLITGGCGDPQQHSRRHLQSQQVCVTCIRKRLDFQNCAYFIYNIITILKMLWFKTTDIMFDLISEKCNALLKCYFCFCEYDCMAWHSPILTHFTSHALPYFVLFQWHSRLGAWHQRLSVKLTN